MTGFHGLVTKSVKGKRGDVGRFVTLKTGRAIFIRKGGYPGPGHCGLPGQVGGSRPRGACGGVTDPEAAEKKEGPPQPAEQWASDLDADIERDFEGSLSDRFKSTAEYKEWATERAKELVATSEGIAINVPVDALGEIVADGRMKNAFDEGAGQRFGHPEEHDEYMRVRRELDEGQFGIAQDATAADRAIYGYLLPKDADLRRQVADTYGEVFLHLREGVEERSTVSFGDSLDECADNWPRLAPSPLTNPDYRSFSMWSDYNNPLWEDWSSVGDLATYAETQIFGGVSLGDIKKISVPKGTDLGRETLSKLKGAGIEINEY